MAYTLHSNHSQLLTIHQQSMMASLVHRLEIARAAHNFSLVEQLEREKQQIASNSKQRRILGTLTAWLKSFQQGISQAISANSKLEVSQFGDGSDRWWYAFDPRTGECVYADSEAELRIWIKENYEGR